jgi:hypothetical protein
MGELLDASDDSLRLIEQEDFGRSEGTGPFEGRGPTSDRQHTSTRVQSQLRDNGPDETEAENRDGMPLLHAASPEDVHGMSQWFTWDGLIFEGGWQRNHAGFFGEIIF